MEGTETNQEVTKESTLAQTGAIGQGEPAAEAQKFYEELEDCGTRLMEYKENFEIMGKTVTAIPKPTWKPLLCE